MYPLYFLCSTLIFFFIYRLLKDYVSKLTDDHKYSITVAIGGTLKENDEFCIVLAYDDHVETMHRRFKQIDFEHVYSIQPINRFDDMNNALYIVDNSLNNCVNLPSSIKRKEIGNDSMSEKRGDVIEMEIDLPLTKQTNLPSNQVQNHKNEKTAITKLDKTQKEVILIFHLVLLFVTYKIYFIEKWIGFLC